MEIEKVLSNKFKERFKQDVMFKNVTTFRIGGKIRYFVSVLTQKEVIFLTKFCKSQKIPFFVLGGGSNLLASDKGFSGLVISTLKMNKICFEEKNIVKAECGAYLSSVVVKSRKKELGGIEWAVGIPGTIGGATLMNAGAFGGQISDFLESVTFFDGTKTKTLTKNELQFSYRKSSLKDMKNIFIFSVKLRLFKEKCESINENIKVFTQKRLKTQNVGYPSAGSVFKRLPHITSAEMIDQANLKGTRVGDAMVSTVHSGYIVNLGGATCKDVLKLIDFILKSVYNRFVEHMELEIILIGDKNE